MKKDKTKKNTAGRIQLLDELRGFAILAMIVHHFFLDLGDVLSVDAGYEIFRKLCVVQPLFWAIFIIISGICSRLSRNVLKRGMIVFLAGGLVTLVTAVIMPKMGIYNAQIYFGILSCLGSCMLITGVIMPLIEKTPVWAGLGISAFLFFATYHISEGSLLFGLIKLPSVLYETNYFAPLGFFNTSFKSADYFAVFPWVFMFLFGAFIGKFAVDGMFPKWTYKSHCKVCAFVGRNSLWFYLAHQVVIYGILYIVLGLLVLYTKMKVG